MTGRAKRRASRSSARSRRTPARPRSEGGFRVPWQPVAVIVGIAAVVGVLAYVVWQSSSGESGNPFSSEASIEGDPAPDLPGEFVDLQTIYDGSYGGFEGNNTAPHVTADVDYSEQGFPPAGGPHWGSSRCAETPDASPPFCGPLNWGIYRDEWPAESVVHALEHGGMAVWYNTANQEVVADLEDLVRDRLEDDFLVVMIPFSDMEDETVAATGWSRRLSVPADEYDRDVFADFLDELKCRFNPEEIPGRGC